MSDTSDDKSELNALVCVVCGAKTQNVFNISFKAKPICESCANTITIQQVTRWCMGARNTMTTYPKGG